MGHERTETTAGSGGDTGVAAGSRHERNVQLVRDLESLRVGDPAGYAEAMALLDDLEQRVRDQKK